MKAIHSIEQLDKLIDNGTPMFWYSNLFKIALPIEYIDKTTYSFNYIKARLQGINSTSDIKLKDIFTK